MKRETVKRGWMAVLMMLVVCFACTAFRPVSAQAKTVVVKTTQYTSKVGRVNKRAKAVKRGTTTLKTSGGFVKFTAPKTKVYTFTFSNVATVGADPAKDINNGHAYLETVRHNYLSSNQVKTNGGKAYSLYMCTPYSWSLGSTQTVSYTTSIPQRFGRLKLNKGQTVYIYTWFVDKPCMVDLTIK